MDLTNFCSLKLILLTNPGGSGFRDINLTGLSILLPGGPLLDRKPTRYTESNIVGFLNILEAAGMLRHPLTYASSSSVYGGGTKMPFATTDRVDHPLSLYATKKATN